MKTLVLATSQFPFGTSESFIASEFPFLERSFDKIIVIAQNVIFEKTRDISSNTILFRYNPATSFSGFLFLPVLLISNLKAISTLYKEEIAFRKNLTTRNKKNLLKQIIKSIQLRIYLEKVLKKEGINESIVFYSYWLKTGAHAISMLNYENSIKISRAHGSDLYEEKTESGYLPLLKFSAQNLDAIFFTSQNGKRYFEEKVGFDSSGFLVSYLGVFNDKQDTVVGRDVACNVPTENSNRFTIVSCSNLIPLKRIDLIIRALSIINTTKKIEWKHFGDGILKNELEELAEKTLSKKIAYTFMGHYPNKELLKYYNANHIDLFINASSTEGIPVSIMEAQSYGIPVIATDTGAVEEIVVTGTGSLLPVDCTPSELASLIEYYVNLDEKETKKIRENAILNWRTNFRASSNYENFITQVSSILASAK
jgi:glycosyltransferase involved in cell wall biosynthesis